MLNQGISTSSTSSSFEGVPRAHNFIMDITALTYSCQLPRILDDLATCSFVTIDLEFSGICKSYSGPSNRPQTLQERYVETKNAAEKYQVLQVGLTTCHEDAATGGDLGMKPTERGLCQLKG